MWFKKSNSKLKKRGLVIFLVIQSFLLAHHLTIGQIPNSAGVDTNAKIKSLFIYNFTKYIEWPTAMRDGNFIIGIYGNYPTLNTELNKIAKTKKRGIQSFEIANFTSLDEINNCHILYIHKEKSDHLEGIITKLKNAGTLLVTDQKGLAKQGAAINFYDFENKQRMEINPSNLEKYNLKVSSQLLALSTIVN